MAYLYLKQKVFSIGEKFTFFDVNQNPVFTARGSFFRIPKRYQLFDAQDPSTPLIDITRKVFSFMPQFFIADPANGHVFCKVRQRFRFGGARFDLETPVGYHEIAGKIMAHDFKITNANGQVVVGVQKKWIAWGDTYEIFFDPNLISAKVTAALVLTIDCAIHSNNN